MSTTKNPPGNNPPGNNPPAKKPRTKKSPAGTPPAPRPPDRTDVVPALGRGKSFFGKEVPNLGFPLERCLSCSLADLEQSQDDVNGVAGMMTLPLSPGQPRQGAQVRLYTGQLELSYLVYRALDRSSRFSTPVKSEVTPAELLLGGQKSLALGEVRRVVGQGVALGMDGQTYLGARFSFFFKKLLTVYHRRLIHGTQEEALRVAGRFGNIDRLRFQRLQKAQVAQQATAGQKLEIKQTLEEQQNEAAFQAALDLFEKGARPDLQTLRRAQLHAARLEQEYGLLSATDARKGPR